MLFYWVFKATALYALRLWFRPIVEGVENVRSGAVILASNHLSFLDSLLFGAVLPRRATFLAKSSTSNGPECGRLVGWFFRALGQVPIDRSGGSAGDGALRAGVAVLQQGGALGIYPEGTRSPDGRLYRGRTGVARLALTTGAPVLPVAITGTDVAQPPGKVMLRKAPLRRVHGDHLPGVQVVQAGGLVGGAGCGDQQGHRDTAHAPSTTRTVTVPPVSLMERISVWLELPGRGAAQYNRSPATCVS